MASEYSKVDIGTGYIQGRPAHFTIKIVGHFLIWQLPAVFKNWINGFEKSTDVKKL